MNKQEYQELRGNIDLNKKWQPLGQYYFVEAALLSLCVYFMNQGSLFFCIPLISVLMFRNFSLMHDAVHGAVANNKMANNFIGHWSGMLCLLPYTAWKESHLQHHFWSGNIHKDPVMALRISLPKASPATQKIIRATWKAWIPLLALLQYSLFWSLALNHAFKSRSLKKWCSVIAPLAAWTVALSFSPEGFLTKAFLPGLALYLLAVEVVNFPHHLGMPFLTENERAPAWEQYKTARTCIYPKWFARHVVLNFNFHTEHHMFPDAPWYTLEAIHEKLQQALGKKQNVDILFKWTKENRPLDIIDVISKSEEQKKAA